MEYVPSSGAEGLDKRFLFILEVLAGEATWLFEEECRDVLRDSDLLEEVRDLLEVASDDEELMLPTVKPGREDTLDLCMLSLALSPTDFNCLAAGLGAGLYVSLNAGGAGLPVLALLTSLSILM